MRKALLISLLALPMWSNGQSFFAIRQERRLLLTGGIGTSTYYGDLTNPGLILKPKFNLNVGLMKYVSPIIAVRGELNWFMISGSDNAANESGRQARGISFSSSCFELSAIGQVNLFANGNRYYRRPDKNVYAFAGIGLLYFNPVADYKGKSYALASLHTEGTSYSRFAPVIPFGLGFRLKVSPNTNVAIEGGYRKTFTDYLDDVSGKYIAPDANDPVRSYFENPGNPAYSPDASSLNNYTAGSKRGNPSNTDSYFLLNVKVEYYLPYNANNVRRGNGLLNKKRKSTYRYNKRGGVKRR